MSLTPARGRPRKRQSLAGLIEKLGRACREDQALTRLEELVSALFERAIGGDVAAARLILAYLEGTPVARVQAEVAQLPLFSADELAAAERRSLDHRQEVSAGIFNTYGWHGSHSAQSTEPCGAA